MKIKMCYDLTQHQDMHLLDNVDIRQVHRKDIDLLAAAFLDAYIDTIDYEGETPKEAVNEIQHAFDGAYGKLVLKASFCLRIEKEIVSTIFVFLDEETLMIGFMTTKASYKKKGYGEVLLKYTLNKLQQLHFQQVVLYVTKGNHPAQKLYEKLGFKYIED